MNLIDVWISAIEADGFHMKAEAAKWRKLNEIRFIAALLEGRRNFLVIGGSFSR